MQLSKECSRAICSEFKLKNFGFNHDQVDQFYRSQWQSGKRSWIFLIYRWIWALFFVVVFAVCLAYQFSSGRLFIFLTNWGIILCLLTQLVAAILVTRWHFNVGAIRSTLAEDVQRDRAGGPRTPPLTKFYWLLHGMTLTLALVITTIYWAFLYGKMHKPMRFPAISFTTHCLNSVFMLIDFLIVAFPVRLLHTLYAMLLPIIYCCFTVIYFLCGGVDEHGNQYVYPILDWTDPVRGMITFAGVFGLYVVFGVLLFALFHLRRLLHRTCCVIWSPHSIGLI